ncbi:MAG TPA: LysR family transcriptional regulator [Bordetella sp.]|uniref:LysR family transcriptional regulator n=1 Tax=Bordetella sp. TaxID=28081 RepID=UPI002ECFC1FC
MTINFSWLDDFFALATSGNFSRAADERHMTQPAFSRRVRALEEWLGVDLFDRSTQPVRLTETGHWFRQVAQDLQAEVTRIPGEARAIAQASSTTLRFASTHTLSFTFMPRWLRALETRTTVGPIQLDSNTQQKCEALILQSKAQFMLAYGHAQVRGPLDEAGCPNLVVGTDRLIAVSAPDKHGRPVHRLPAEGKSTAVHLLNYSAESGLGRILRVLNGQILDRLHAPNVLTAHLASVLRTMALDGRGLAWLPQMLVGDDLERGRLVMAAPQEWSIALEIRLYRDRASLGKAAEVFWLAAQAEIPTS